MLDSREARLHRVVGDGSHVLILGFESAVLPVRDSLEQALKLATALRAAKQALDPAGILNPGALIS